MKFTVDRNEFLDVTLRLSRTVSNKTSYPVLEGILLSAEQGKVTLIAYNLEMSMKKTIYARVEEEGDIVISARILGDIFKRLSGKTVEISSDEKMVCKISSNGAVFDIPGMDAIDFPEILDFFPEKHLISPKICL